jgi:hypothetical protein
LIILNGLSFALKRFFKNKNTVTILGVVIIIGILYFGYNMQINNAITPISNIPIAKTTIQPRTLVTNDMIEFVDIAPILLRNNVIRTQSQVVGKYTNYNTVVPAGSLFYTGVLVSEESLPDSAFIEVKDGQVPYNFPVDMDSTYGNSIFPGNIVDIYMKATNDASQIMVGKLVENVKVIAVKDNVGRHVFENTDEMRVPSNLIFGVTPEIHILLRKASFMYNYSVELFPVPRGGTVTDEGEIQVSAQQLKDFINANTVNITDTVVEVEE